MKEVAEAARVSIQTVSNFVNGRHGEMRAETRKRVEEAMRSLSYHPNSSARGLRSTRTHALAFLLLDEGAGFLADPMTDRILAGAGDVVRGRHYGLLIQAGRPDGDADAVLSPLLERRADGALLLLSGDPQLRRRYVDRVLELGVPCVVLEETHAGSEAISVVTANRSGARRLADHLLASGHRRIAFIAARVPWPMVEQRRLGYEDALRDAGIEPDPELARFEGTWDARHGPVLARTLLALPSPPTAIMCGNDLLALGVIQGLRMHGVNVPGDVAVSGFNDFDFAAYVDPPLTTVRTPGYELGSIATERLIGAVEGAVPAGDVVTLPPTLVLRDSA